MARTKKEKEKEKEPVKRGRGRPKGSKNKTAAATTKTTKKTTVKKVKKAGRPNTHKGEADTYMKNLVKKLGGAGRGRPKKTEAPAKKTTTKKTVTKKVKKAGRPNTHKGEADTYMKNLVKKLGGSKRGRPKAAPAKKGRGRPKGSKGPLIRNTADIRKIHEKMSGFKYNPKKMEKVRGRKSAVTSTHKGRGRPKGSKDSKPRAKRGSKMTNIASVGSSQIRANVHRTPTPKVGSIKSVSTVKRSRLKAA